MKTYDIRICDMPDCKFPPMLAIRRKLNELSNELTKRRMTVVNLGCIGHCVAMMVIEDKESKQRQTYIKLSPEDVEKILTKENSSS